ncbi:MAG: response regulator [Caulobacterales bacterium]|nr:response regulator [Caulobacterales bacterium]
MGITEPQPSATASSTAAHYVPQSEAAQALTAILQTHYLRYSMILSWGLGLFVTVGARFAVPWLIGTLAAGYFRGVVEKRIAARVGAGYGFIFPAVATVTTCAWAAAPLIAWFSGAPFGQPLAMMFLISGYLLVFTQLRSSPLQAAVISSPYSVVTLICLASLWGTPSFWPMAGSIPFVIASFFVHVVMTMVKEARIRAFQDHQSHLISELETARDRADAANEAKSAFLGVISHELRTPMNGVLGAAQLLSATDLDKTQRDYVSIVRNSGDSLLTLLNDILDMTKIEAGRMEFDDADVNFRDLYDRISGVASAQAQAKTLGYRSELTGEVPAVVRGDSVRVGQILQNLLTNAIKFTSEGEILFRVEGRRLTDDRVAFVFSVTDTGPGIATADLQRLFEPFTQLDGSSTRRHGGTGLGLTISRRLAEIMGGTISVDTRLGKGSTFTFAVEAQVIAWANEVPVDPVVEDAVCERALKVLVVEDHPVNRMIVEAWMASAGHITVLAENGQLALDACAVEAFDLILMDVNMPVMDGLTATRALRSQSGPNQSAPVVVLSASARTEDHEAGLLAGADAYLNKPIDFRALSDLLVRCTAGREAIRQAA